MGRPKIARKSTAVDMTAMCDVAFLLLSFFILTTKFKPSEAVPISTPSSVANKIAPETDLIMISLNAAGHVYLSVGDSQKDKDKKQAMIEELNQRFSLGLTPTDIANLKKAPFIGVPIAQLKQQAALSTDQMNSKTLPGIPCQDTARNEMNDWIAAAVQVYQGGTMHLILKGDNVAKYPVFKNIITAFKKNEQFKFSMVTNPQAVPQGSDLWKDNMSNKAAQ